VILGLIALFTSYDHIILAGLSFGLQQQWGIPLIAVSVAVVIIDPQLRPVRGIELEIEQIKQRSQRNESEAEQRMKQIEERTTHIESETEQFKGENASEKTLSALIKQHCFPRESISNDPKPTEIDCGPSSP
jgi:hypothetical protein